MIIKTYREPQSNQRFACNKRDLKLIFHGIQSLHITFGLTPNFDLSSLKKVSPRPVIKGKVIASASIMGTERLKRFSEEDLLRVGECSLSFYVLRIEDYPDYGVSEFRSNVLPYIANWFKEQLAKLENERLVDNRLIIEWAGEKHKLHEMMEKM